MISDTNDVRERLQEVMRTVQSMLPPGTGVALFCFPYKPGRIEYIANGDREGVVKMLVEWIKGTADGRYAKHLPDELMPPPTITG